MGREIKIKIASGFDPSGVSAASSAIENLRAKINGIGNGAERSGVGVGKLSAAIQILTQGTGFLGKMISNIFTGGIWEIGAAGIRAPPVAIPFCRPPHRRLFVLTAALMVERDKFANDKNRTYNHEDNDNARPEETGRRRFSCWIGLPELFPEFAHNAAYCTIKRQRVANGKTRNKNTHAPVELSQRCLPLKNRGRQQVAASELLLHKRAKIW